jgi:SNF2 family DNA or RNA helicase
MKRYVVFKCGHVNSTILVDKVDEVALSNPEMAALQLSSEVGSEAVRREEAGSSGPANSSHSTSEASVAVLDPPEEVEDLIPEGETFKGKLDLSNFKSCDGSMASYDYQSEGVKFIEDSNHRCLLADATGLGKTIQALISLRESNLKAIIFVKTSLIYQWTEEFRKWKDSTPFKIMPVIKREHLIPGFDAYVMSMDLLGRMKLKELGALASLGVDAVILDEVHNYKNPDAARSRNLIQFLQISGIQKIIALSATPIKNRADEYFTILNLLDPAQFYSMQRFRYSWLASNGKGQYTRIDPYRLEAFKKLTSKYILRREKHEVLLNLPPLSRNFVYVEIEDQNLKNSYNKALDLFSNFLENNAKLNSTEVLGWLAKLRSITGQAKSQNAIDFAQEFLDSTEENLTIGIHHTAVRDVIKYVFQGAGYSCESLSGEDNPYTKNRVVSRFQDGEFRLLIINMKSGGEGLNLQNCANALVLERAWNAADEEQFEGRFHRNGQVQAVNVTYFIARGTIDHFFHEMVAKKRQILGETLSKNWNFESDSDSIRELSEIIIKNKL